MKVKLDENIGARGEQFLRERGHDVETVAGQRLSGTSDESLIGACLAERRVLVSLDKDFASILRFPPAQYAGIVVLRLPEPLTLAGIEAALHRLVSASGIDELAGKLWIIDAHRVREFEQDGPP